MEAVGGEGRSAGRRRQISTEIGDPVQRSQVAQDLSTIANVLQNAAVSGNLNPELGPTPRVDIPTPNLDVDNQPLPGAAHPEGFGDTLKDTDQFAPRATLSGIKLGYIERNSRVTFQKEVLISQVSHSRRYAIETGSGRESAPFRQL